VQGALEAKVSVPKVMGLLTAKVDPAVRRANAEGISTGYLERWAKNLYNSDPPTYHMVVEPTALGFTVVRLDEAADVPAAESALVRLQAAQSLLIKRAQKRQDAVARGADPKGWADRIQRDEKLLSRVVSRLHAVKVDPIFLQPGIDHVAALVAGFHSPPPTEFVSILRQREDGEWMIEPLKKPEAPAS
jgi:hypothetical protein